MSRAVRIAATSFAIVAALGAATAFCLNVAHWWWLNDDAFITLRYARNLVEGHGLVFNPGERVEGYTEFLFTLIVAGGMKLGLAPELFANVVLVGCGVTILAVVTFVGARRFGWTSPLTWFAPLLLALHRVFCGWSTSGMAMQLFALFVLAGLLRLARERREPDLRPWGSALWLAAAALTRPEGWMAAGIAGGFLLLDVVRRRARRPRSVRALLGFAFTFGAIAGSHLLWRHHYYGFWLPNTFYAKVSGLYPEQGLVWFGCFLSDFPLHWFAPLLLVLLLPGSPRRAEHALFATYGLAHFAYLIAIGGDWHEFRFFLPVLPLLALLFADAFERLAAAPPGSRRASGRVLAAAAAVGLLVTTQLGSHRPEAARGEKLWSGVATIDKLAQYTKRRTKAGLLLRQLVDEGKLPADLRIAVGGAGVVPWYSRLWTFDVLGLNDLEVARLPVETRGIIGHEKFATRAMLVAHQIALFDSMNAIVWQGPPEKLPRQSISPVDRGAPLRCVKVADQQYLVFSTALDEADFRATFGKLEIIY